MKPASIFLIILMITAGASGTFARNNRDKNGKDSVVAKVGSISVTMDEFVNGYNFGPAFYKRVKNSKSVYLENLIREKLLALDGRERGLDTTRDVKEFYNAFRDDLATEALFKDVIQSKIEITQAEIDTVAKQKLIDVDVEWLYSPTKEGITAMQDSLKHDVAFSKLYNLQLNDTVTVDDRSMKTSRYQIEMKNPGLGQIIDKLESGEASLPVKTNDGWYIVMLKNFSYNLVPSVTEQNKILDESKRAVMKMKMDRMSDEYVNKMMLEQNPVIKRKPFQVLRSYLAGFELPKEKYNSWKLGEILEDALKEFNSAGQTDYSKIILVELGNGNISVSDFISWYRVRDQYVKLNDKSFAQYSKSLEQAVWRMVRDKLLCRAADAKGYYTRPEVIEQSGWWMDKILYAEVKNELINSIMLENKEITADTSKAGSQSELIDTELTKKLFYRLNTLKKKYPVSINNGLLEKAQVDDEEDIKAIEFYTVKKGGLIPRTPYPSIDNFWASWQ